MATRNANRRLGALVSALGSGSAASAPAAASLEGFGEHVFTGAVAEKYLANHGGSAAMLDDYSWTEDDDKSELVAAGALPPSCSLAACSATCRTGASEAFSGKPPYQRSAPLTSPRRRSGA